MDLERVFQSFLVTYKDEKQATLDFNNTFTMVEYLNRILEKLGNEYEDSMNIRFSEMQKFSDILMEIQRQLRYLGLLLKVDVSTLLNRAIETESTDLIDYLNKFIFYVVGFISKYEKTMEILHIEDEIKKLNESVKVIELRTAELENMLTQNVPEISTAISNITTLNSRIKTALQVYIKLT
jgi:hypothetical protein